MKEKVIEDFELQFKEFCSDLTKLYTVDCNRSEMWKLFIGSLTGLVNMPHIVNNCWDCSCCRNGIYLMGRVVKIINNKLYTIFDMMHGFPEYRKSFELVNKYVKSCNITSKFYPTERNFGQSHSLFYNSDNDELITYYHFFSKIYVRKTLKIDEVKKLQMKYDNNYVNWKNMLKEISIDSIKTVLNMIEDNMIYNGQKYVDILNKFLNYKLKYSSSNKYLFELETVSEVQDLLSFKNTAMYQLLLNIANGDEILISLSIFHQRVVPDYKYNSSAINKSVFNNVKDRVRKISIENTLKQKFASVKDISNSDILFIDKYYKEQHTNKVFNHLIPTRKPNNQIIFDSEGWADIYTFVKDILPQADTVELFIDKNKKEHLVSLVNLDETSDLTGNNFVWTYANSLEDSLRDQVIEAGGNVNGVLRCSLRWNEENNNQCDYDLHCVANGNEIYYGNRIDNTTKGKLDVDMMLPLDKPGIENITFSDLKLIKDGSKFVFYVENYNVREGDENGFYAEIEFDNKIYSFEHRQAIGNRSKVIIAEVDFKDGKFKIDPKISYFENSVWSDNDNEFIKVNLITYSPNYWKISSKTGTRHTFFFVDKMKNNTERDISDDYNSLQHKEVFDVMGKYHVMKPSNRELQGFGFSATNCLYGQVIVRINGSRIYVVYFY
jgi:hypothetical protein